MQASASNEGLGSSSACAISISKALQRLEPSFPLIHIVSSISTEATLHQLINHYHINSKHHITVYRA
jgi:hypothetical protein